MKSVIIGASTGLGRALSENLALAGHDLYLISRDKSDLSPLANDLSLRYGVKALFKACDITQTDAHTIKNWVDSEFGTIDNLFIPAGYSDAKRDQGQVDPAFLKQIVAVNYLAPISITNCFFNCLSQNPSANIVLIGSVAADRGRSKNCIYSSAKRGLETYFETLRHQTSKLPIHVQFYRLGWIDTNMNFGDKKPKLSPSLAAQKIISNLGKDTGVKYLPSWWGIVILILSFLPWSIYKKLKF